MLLSRSQLVSRGAVRASVRPAPVRSAVLVRAKAAEAEVISKKDDKKKQEVAAEEEEFDDGPVPSTAQVESLVNALCNETDIAEMNLRMGSFSLKIKRSMSGHHHAPVHMHAAAAAAPAPAAAAPVSVPEPTAEDTVDESLIHVHAPKVGVFRRGKYQAGKRVGKANCVNEGDKVRKGQALGYVEQLGTYFPVEAPIPGEVTKFMVPDGAPVEYLQEVLELSPFFGGHIIGDSKHA